MNNSSAFTQSQYLLILILVIAFIIRLPALNQSLWLDEATTANVVSTLTMSQILSDYAPNDFHPPGYYLFMRGWVLLFGTSEIAIRMPSVLFSLATGWLVYLITVQLQKMNSAKQTHQANQLPLIAAALFLFNPLIIYYAQEARMYMMATFWCAASLFFFLKAFFTDQSDTLQSLWQSRAIQIALLNICIVLGFLTFYGSVFFFASLYFALLIIKGWRDMQYLLPAPLAILLLGGPLLYSQIIYAQTALQIVPNWSLVLGTVTAKNLLLIPIKFSIGRIDFDPQIVYYAIAGLWTLVVMAVAMAGMMHETIQSFFPKSKKRSIPLMTVLFFFPLLLGMIFSLWSPLLQYFRFLYLIPVMAILIAFGVQYIQELVIRKKNHLPHLFSDQTRHLPFVLIAVFLVFSVVYLFIPQFHREDWKALTNQLKETNSPVYMVASAADPVKYYAPEQEIIPLRSLTAEPLRVQQLIVLPYVADIHGIAYQDILRQQQYRQADTVMFRDLTYELWEKTERYATIPPCPKNSSTSTTKKYRK